MTKDTSPGTSAWGETSIMAKRGLAKGREGKRHDLTIAAQGDFHYVYGPYAKPVLTIDPGDIAVVETEDAFGGVITSEKDKPTEKLKFPFLNPQSGPIAVNGAAKGDCLAVRIHAVETRGAQPAGTTCIIPEFGGLVGTAATALLNPPLPERVRKMHVDKNGVRWSDKIVLPYEPFIGTIGVSPQIEAISSLQPDYHGGNMDLPDVAPGAIIYFPVHYGWRPSLCRGLPRHAGRRRSLRRRHRAARHGHAAGRSHQGLELCLAPSRDEGFHHDHRQRPPLEDAGRIAYRELARWMSADYGFDEIDAYMFLSQAGRVRLGNMVDPKYTMGASILKKYLSA